MTIGSLFAQEKTTVTAKNSDISDNLDLRAVATVFGDASNLEDFERRLNDPKTQISNLDLNNDNYVDYLRVIETVEGNVHLVVVQAVLEKDVFQDVATIEVNAIVITEFKFRLLVMFTCMEQIIFTNQFMYTLL